MGTGARCGTALTRSKASRRRRSQSRELVLQSGSEGGGSLQDYLGYGTTLGTWFHGGRKPIEVTCVMNETEG